MKTRKELQNQIENLQSELKIVETLCKYVPEKYAICFGGMVVDSGYSMGEVVRYSINGDIIMDDGYCQDYAKSCRYKAKHGLVIFDFKNRKQLKEYCEARGKYSDLCKSAVYYRNEISRMRGEIIIHRYRGETKTADSMHEKINEYYEKLNARNAEIAEQVRICKAMLLAVYDEKNSVVKKLTL